MSSGPFPLQPYYSRGKNMKFYSTSHVNTFLSITNDRGDDCHSEKASRIKKKHFCSVFVIFYGFVIFFSKMCVQTFGLSPWIKSIGILEVFFRSYYESLPSRKCIQIEIWTYGTSSNIRDYTLKLPICRILASGPFSLQPYYSRGKNVKFYSTSHYRLEEILHPVKY